MKDEEIIALYFKRDENAIKETDISYRNYLFSISHGILYDDQDSEECVWDTYRETWDLIPPNRPAILRIFLGKLTRRISLNRFRFLHAEKRGGGEVTLSFDELEDCIAADSLKTENELTELIDAFLFSLKPLQRKVFVCRYWYFDSIGDIAKRFNCSQGKIKMMLKRLRDDLKAYLIEQGAAYEKQ